MARIDEATARRNTESISVRLTLGHQYYICEYESVKAMAPELFEDSSRDLELLVANVQLEHRLLFTAGCTAVQASRFSRGPLDYLGEEYEEIGPEEPLVLERAAYYRDSSVVQTELEANQLYVGDFDLMVAVSSLAKSLTEQGTLTLVTAAAALALQETT